MNKLTLLLLCGALVSCKDWPPEPPHEIRKASQPTISYFMDQQTQICFAEFTVANGNVKITSVPCTGEVLAKITPWPDYYR